MPILRGRKSTLSFCLYQCPSLRTGTDVKTKFHRDRPNSRSGLDSADRVGRSFSNKDTSVLAARESLRSIPSSRCKRYRRRHRRPRKHGSWQRALGKNMTRERADWQRVEAVGGARRDRTDDLLLAKQALSQLSYGPGRKRSSGRRLYTAPRLSGWCTR
jgi:hypothetical protein